MKFATLIKTLAVRSGIPSSRKLDHINQLLLFGEWLKTHRPARHFANRYQLYAYLNTEILEDCPITFLEFGVYMGSSIRKWSEANNNVLSVFWGFDTFEGLPEDWSSFWGSSPKGTFDTKGLAPSVDDQRVNFVKGLFQETLPSFLSASDVASRLIVHLDADLYSSTLYVLSSLHPFLVVRTIIIFDEFSLATHEFRAFMDYASAFRVSYKVLAASGPIYNQVAIEIT